MLKMTIELGKKTIRTYTTDKTEFFIGRDADNDIQIDNLAVSGRHARIVKENDAYSVEDLGSTNGTFVDGEKITKKAINGKNRIGIGKYTLILNSADGQSKAPSFVETMKI